MRHTGAFCRAIAHSWHLRHTSRYSPQLTQLKLECSNCGSLREDLWNKWGVVRARKYHYSAGYLRLGSGRKRKKLAWRVLFLRGRYILRRAA